jgi:hypothetical protein
MVNLLKPLCHRETRQSGSVAWIRRRCLASAVFLEAEAELDGVSEEKEAQQEEDGNKEKA